MANCGVAMTTGEPRAPQPTSPRDIFVALSLLHSKRTGNFYYSIFAGAAVACDVEQPLATTLSPTTSFFLSSKRAISRFTIRTWDMLHDDNTDFPAISLRLLLIFCFFFLFLSLVRLKKSCSTCNARARDRRLFPFFRSASFRSLYVSFSVTGIPRLRSRLPRCLSKARCCWSLGV